MIYSGEEDAASVHRLANAIWNRGLTEEVNNWEASMNAAALIYAAQIQADAVESFSDAVWERLRDIQGTIHHSTKEAVDEHQ